MKFSYLWCVALFSMSAPAAVLEYGAGLDQSSWRLSGDSPLECRLEHFIPGYGSGAFVTRAGKNINLDFELKPFKPNARIQTVTLRSFPPRWRPGLPESKMSTIRFYKQFDGLVNGQTAWTMAGELEQGRIPTFLFRDWYHSGQPVQVSVSSVGFYPRYQSFLMCLQGLLPYTFDDIAFTILNYEKNSDQLTPYSKRRIEMIGEYVKADPSIGMLVINAYTDSYGGRWPNQKLSERRAQGIKAYFAALGVDPARIEVDGHGEKQHIATNETERGRAKNRRVIISMSRGLPAYETRGQEIGGPIYVSTEPTAAAIAQGLVKNNPAAGVTTGQGKEDKPATLDIRQAPKATQPVKAPQSAKGVNKKQGA